ncbi:PAS domain-containing methyl-accepting chemotaxis protein [uncultured Halovibrio sp.]|uniref:methyl-accepting chemotaxis protein n=1 Tax=uncultured Halovibrio sp. TaxID=985049 RepID=UPI0025DFA159|nr:PAS domain-containing methyl-accepting chemotaxis protein [uncultured Halovibrio sp.]
MRTNQPVTQRRVPVKPNANILSTTDPKGRITYVNDEFIEISGFTHEELIGQPHNIIRHPDMPRQAFFEFWDAIRNGRSWMGMVKNRCKNGDHYWVHAYVTPILNDNGDVVEFQSIRQTPDEEAVERASALYAKVRASESDSGSIKAGTARGWYPGVTAKVFMISLAAMAIMGAGLLVPESVTLATVILPAGLALLLGGLFWATAPIRSIEALTRNVLDDPLVEQVLTGRRDELARVETAMISRKTELKAVPKRLLDTVKQIRESAAAASESIAQARQSSSRQTDETQQVATAMEEMSQAVQEVAGNSSNGADTAKGAHEQTTQGKSTVKQSANSVRELTDLVSKASGVIEELAGETQRIGSALDLIQQITDQTNLLALNAAIEAARAGEAGRGFAVVADEVRNLASSTSESTKEIQAIIESLQNGSHQAVEAMRQSRERAQDTLSQAEESHSALEKIEAAVEAITDISNQIASATEEQSSTAEEVNKNISNIDNLSGELNEQAEGTDQRITELVEEVERTTRLVSRFANAS